MMVGLSRTSAVLLTALFVSFLARPTTANGAQQPASMASPPRHESPDAAEAAADIGSADQQPASMASPPRQESPNAAEAAADIGSGVGSGVGSPVICGAERGSPANGGVDENGRVICDAGYALEGNPLARCSPDGKWWTEFSHCTYSCGCTAPGIAYYNLTFKAKWQNPSPRNGDGFHSGFGVVHNACYSMWRAGTKSTDEFGDFVKGKKGAAKRLYDIAEPFPEPRDKKSENFPFWIEDIRDVRSNRRPARLLGDDLLIASRHGFLVSVVMGLNRSPDWFVGLDSVNLCNGTEWINSLTLDAYPYDAGVDDAVNWESTVVRSSRQVISEIATSYVRAEPFRKLQVLPMGTFTISKINETPGKLKNFGCEKCYSAPPQSPRDLTTPKLATSQLPPTTRLYQAGTRETSQPTTPPVTIPPVGRNPEVNASSRNGLSSGTIPPVGRNPEVNASSRNGLSSGGIAGIVVGILILAVIVAFVVLKTRPQNKAVPTASATDMKVVQGSDLLYANSPGSSHLYQNPGQATPSQSVESMTTLR